ncbi:MAG: pilus assembly protein [Lachnospiraceae bacterium]|nr:pilus assembly protein [Lachnospiraceae bacterium]
MISLKSKNKPIFLNRVSAPVLPGSLTVETAVVLPLFLFAVLTLLYLAETIRLSGNVEEALHQSARELATYSYAYTHGTNDESLGLAGGKAVSLTLGRSMVLKHAGSSYLDESPISGGSGGLSFLRSSVLGNDDTIDLIATWKIKPLFSFFGIKGSTVQNRARIKAFTGFDNTRHTGEEEKDEEIVYITESGTVYHRDRGCRHLNLSIRETSPENVKNERNESGARYYPCEFCGSLNGSGKLYVTDDGDRFHTSLSCPGLKRGIRAVPISEVGGRPPCKRCGY